VKRRDLHSRHRHPDGTSWTTAPVSRYEDDYGVLLGRPGLFFFLGLENGRDPPLTTDQLATVAKEIARVVYVD
jgi:hypothetical protein